MEIDRNFLKGKLLERDNDSHKGDYGHLLLVCGSDSMPGAAVLATGAALRSGCGLVSLHSSERVCAIAASRYPSAIYSSSDVIPDVGRYSAVVAGPGLGLSLGPVIRELLVKCSDAGVRMLLDADALTLLSRNPDWMGLVPPGSVMTPHDGELARFAKLEPDKDAAVRELVSRSGCVVVSKGYRTHVYDTDGSVYVNTTGNPGMAKGGSGDVLAGLVGGLMARGYDTLTAAQLGVWIHGFAGDRLSKERTMEAYDSSDILNSLYSGFHELYKIL